ncbi:MAG: thioesterase family protein [Kiloniellales bacterium]|nr:thioesterase family protein [Kiloniellales bacterium]
MSGYIETFRGVVYPWHCDHQGHMTTMHYVGMFDAAFWHLLSAQGFTRAYLGERGTGFADVRDTIEYLAELPVGSPLAIESGLLKVGTTSIVSFNRMRDTETGRLAATSEKVTVYFDLSARRKIPLPTDLKAAMEGRLAARASE